MISLRAKVPNLGCLLLSSCLFTLWGTQETPRENSEEAAAKPKTIEDFTASFRRLEGFLPLYLDSVEGKVWAEFPAPGTNGVCLETLYVEALRSGLGSNPIGLDRGQLGRGVLLRVRRLANKVLFELPNLRFRASSESFAERRAVEESFASSVLFGTQAKILNPDGRSLVDLSSFLLRDAHGVGQTLQRSQEGSFRVDQESSAIDFSQCLAFPDNVELESILTYRGEKAGSEVRSVAVDNNAFTLVQHHSFIRLPDEGYSPRTFDPRCGAFSTSFVDYSAPIKSPLKTQWVNRHRLIKDDPDHGEIVYHIDSGAPEPIRSALLDGARWWSEAFDEAGFPGAFRVEILPEGVHPLDVRYNVVQWVHRATRGWSYGASVVDPRTGEILKGHVSLGSLRVRQDRLIFDGLFGADGTPDSEEIALARIRQLSAHEIGHTLGLAHNFAASTYGGRASVMDYPAPLIRVDDDGELDASDAYDVGIGLWDIRAIKYLYTQYKDARSEGEGLQDLLRENQDQGWIYITDADARPKGSSHPLAHLWDNGQDPVSTLEETLRVREIALERLGAGSLRSGSPLAQLHEVFVPIYLYHRYQVEAVSKVVGGFDYDYGMMGSRVRPMQPVAREDQIRALDALLQCLDSKVLSIPQSLVQWLLPRPPGYGTNRELFRSRTGLTFDRDAAIETCASLVLELLFHPERAERLFQAESSSPQSLSLGEVLVRVQSFIREQKESPQTWLSAGVFAKVLMKHAADDRTSPRVRASYRRALKTLAQTTLAKTWDVYAGYVQEEIEDFLAGKAKALDRLSSPLPIPPGSPIGTECSAGSFFLESSR